MHKYILRKEYDKWLKDNGISKPQPYHDFLNTFKNREIDRIFSLVLSDEILYANTLLDKLEVEKKQLSYYKKFCRFIRHLERSKRKHYLEECKNDLIVEKQPFENTINFQKKQLSKMDAMQPLIDVLGEDTFVKLAIESSYFFSEYIIKDRLLKIRETIRRNEKLPGRSGIYNSSVGIGKLDDKGNTKLYSIINSYTGYNLAEGKNSVLKNYIVSHVWGEAIDPLFYSNLWNVVLVPAWANHLMDKNNEENTVGSKLKMTIQKICTKLYSLDEYSEEELMIDKSLIACKHPNDILKGKYYINKIQQTENHRKLGKITCDEHKL